MLVLFLLTARITHCHFQGLEKVWEVGHFSISSFLVIFGKSIRLILNWLDYLSNARDPLSDRVMWYDLPDPDLMEITWITPHDPIRTRILSVRQVVRLFEIKQTALQNTLLMSVDCFGSLTRLWCSQQSVDDETSVTLYVRTNLWEICKYEKSWNTRVALHSHGTQSLHSKLWCFP